MSIFVVMNELLTISLIISLCITAIFATTWKNMLLHDVSLFIKKWLEEHKMKLVYKPLFGCLICMSSFWTVIAWFFLDFGFLLIPVVLCVAGINTIITAIITPIIDIDDVV